MLEGLAQLKRLAQLLVPINPNAGGGGGVPANSLTTNDDVTLITTDDDLTIITAD